MTTAAALEDAFTPEPPQAPQAITEPARQTPVHAVTDVLVVGGGPAGFAASLAARRVGADVLLVERYNHLGGLSTGGLVIWIDRMTDWSGRLVIAGIGQELLERLPADAVAGAPRSIWGSTDTERVAHWRERQGAFSDTVTWSPMIDPEWLKYLSQEMLIEAGVKLLLHSWVASPLLAEDQRHLMQDAGGELGFVERPVVGWSGDVALFLGPRLTGYSGVDVSDLTRVEVESRRRMLAHLHYFRRHAPGFGHAWLMLSAPQIGVRHTRRLLGRHKLTIDDWRASTVFEDEIGVSPSPSQKFANVSVPYGALVARDLANLLAPGRHMSCDPQTQAFMREIPQCWLTGQAAGVGAALAAGAGGLVAEVDVPALQAELQRQRVHLQADSTAAMAGGPPRGPKVSITADTPAL